MSRKNKLDPYLDEIKDLVYEGYSSRKIMDYLLIQHDCDVAQNQLLLFIKKHDMRLQVEQGRKKVPICRECKDCLEFVNYNGNGTILICSRTNRQINHYAVAKSPVWCPRRFEEGEINV